MKELLLLLLMFSTMEVSRESFFPSNNTLVCDDCTEELVKRDGKLLCQAKILLSDWIPTPSSSCKCVCGEGEREAYRTCSWYENTPYGDCVLKSENYKSTNPCANEKTFGKIKCEKDCVAEVQLVDRYIYTKCQMENHLCGKCSQKGTRMKYSKCRVFKKTDDFECKKVLTSDIGICGAAPVNDSCDMENTDVCIIKEIEIGTTFSFFASSSDTHVYTAWDTFGNACNIGDLGAKKHVGLDELFPINMTCPDVCLDNERFLNVSIKSMSTDVFSDNWNGDVHITLKNGNQTRSKYSNGYEDVERGKTSTFIRSW